MLSPCQQRNGQLVEDRDPVTRIAQCDQEVIQALELVYRAYLRSGFIGPNPYELRVTPYHLLPDTQVLVSLLDGEAVSTTTLIGDGELGLPMEDLYADEVAVRRQMGLRLAEASCLADRREDSERTFSMLVRLMSLTAQVASYQEIDQLLIAVHPRHGAFYKRFFGFQVIGEEKSYEAVNSKPAVPLALDLHRISERCPRGYKRLFGKPLPVASLRPRKLSDDLQWYLGEVVKKLYPVRNSCPANECQTAHRKPFLEMVG